MDLQNKLWRVMQERDFERQGDETPRRVDVRRIAATHRDLEAESSAERFRQDLDYHVDVFSIHVLSLRDRAADIGLLSAHFVRVFSQLCPRQHGQRERSHGRDVRLWQCHHLRTR